MPESKQKAHVMTNEEFGSVVDEFSAAVAALATEVPADKIERLARATGNLLETLASRAAAQSAGAFTAVYAELKRELSQTNKRIDRKQTKENSTRTIVEDLQERIVALERHVGGTNGN